MARSSDNDLNAAGGERSLDRLRDRTDELELIISSLTTFALFSLPGWALETLAAQYTLLSTTFALGGILGTTILSGLCYGLGFCFVVHLMARAYWVGLIGLRAAFPSGIQWERLPTIGPHTQESLQQSLPDLQALIHSADRFASSLFAVISVLTLGMLWFATVFIVVIAIAANIGEQFAATNAVLGVAALAMFLIFGGIPILVYLIDVQLAGRFQRVRDSRAVGVVISVLRRISGLAYPQQLLAPVQLTLQSNMRPLLFPVGMAIAVTFIVFAGNWRVATWRDFTVGSEFTYLTGDDVRGGFRSTYYEDMASGKDRIRAFPRLSSFVQNGSALRVFLPYQPLRDNLPLQQICDAEPSERDNVDCLRKLWTISFNETDIAMESFIAAERFDLNMRGLIGFIPLEAITPGMHQLNVSWGASIVTPSMLDDRYDFVTQEYAIPFLFAPEYERSVPGAP